MRKDYLKIIAILSMTIDHVGAIFFPQYIIMRQIGRLAMPIFTFGIASGYIHTHSVPKYGGRLLLFALLSLFPYYSLFGGINTLFTLLYGLTALYIYDRINKYAAVLWIALSALIPQMDYGIYGVLMIFLFYIFYEQKLFCLLSQILLSLLYVWSGGSVHQLFCLAALPLILWGPGMRVQLPKYFFYVYYPAHLLVIYFIQTH